MGKTERLRGWIPAGRGKGGLTIELGLWPVGCSHYQVVPLDPRPRGG